jgi:hypothetical protein
MGVPLLLPLGIHKSNLGAVWDEVLLDTGEIVEVTRENENMRTWICVVLGGGWCAVATCNSSGNTSTLSGSEWEVLVACSRRTTYMLLLLEWSLVSYVVLKIWSVYYDLKDRNLVSWIWISCSWLNLSFTSASLSSCPIWICLWCCISLVSIDRQSVRCRRNHIHWECCTHLKSLVPSHPSPVQGTWRSLCVADEHIQSCVLTSQSHGHVTERQPLTGSSNRVWWTEGSTNMSVLCVFHVYAF